jgi:anti-sigma regulatory factor (Ser/Thr protein kinase)
VGELNETFPAVPESVPRARRAVGDFARRRGVAADVLPKVALAVSEACTNVVLHAYRDAEETGDLEIRAEIVDEHLRVVVSDTGVGLTPHLDSPGLGLGLPIISQTAAVFEVRSSHAGGTELCMRFPLSERREDARTAGSTA